MSERQTLNNRQTARIQSIVSLVEELGGETTMSNDQLAARLNLAPRTFTRALAAADGNGIVVEYRRANGPGDVARTIRLQKANPVVLEVAS